MVFTDAAVGKSPTAEFGAKRETLELVSELHEYPTRVAQPFPVACGIFSFVRRCDIGERWRLTCYGKYDDSDRFRRN